MVLTIMHGYAIKNKATKDLAPMPLLTDNLNMEVLRSMATDRIPKLSKKAKDLTDKRSGRLIALSPTEKRCSGGNIIWRCICDCGNIAFIPTHAWGKTESCGCITRTHGMWRTPTYNSWDTMIQRCTNPQNTNYKYYGNRGIKVCERWHKFESFLEDMGKRPGGMTLERKDNDGNYYPENCEWIPSFEQAGNTRKNKWFQAISPEGKFFMSRNRREFARQHNLSHRSVASWVRGDHKNKNGWRFHLIGENSGS